jgi:hypothetical protein
MKAIIGFILLVVLCSFSVAPVLKTNLRITILNELGNIEDSVAVTIYRDENDYREEVNPVTPVQYTDKKGRTTFTDLEPVEYYIHAQKGDKTNVGAGVVADALLKGKMNKLTIIIE